MKKNSAFSFIELSIVIIIIGVLIAGTVIAGKLVKKSRIAAAQSLTQSSIVKELPDLVAWFETSLISSFLENEARDGNSISIWYDNNPKAVTKNNAIQGTGSYQPKFYENIFNGAIPAIRFDGSNDFMTFDGSSLANSAYTIFIVEQRRDNDSNSFFIGGSNSSINANLHLGYRDNTTITQDHFSNDMNYTIASYSVPIPRMHSFVFDTTNGKRYWLNGGITPDASAAQTSAITSYDGSGIGRTATGNYNGDIAEVIIFKRLLKTEERQKVEDYLSKKYGIAIS